MAVATAAAIVSALLVPLGFQGRDDLHYLLAAQQWLNGPLVGADHWANRIPYVLAIAGAYRFTGGWEASFYLLHSVCFICVAICIWLIGRRSFECPEVAWFGLAVLCATPLLFRLPSTFYPEAFEIALSAITAAMVLGRDRVRGELRLPWMLLAGLLGGLVLSVRQTAVALPVAIAALILLDSSVPFRQRVRELACLASGFAMPIIAELAYYWAMTGNPLHRLSIDAHHIERVSPSRLVGGVPPESTRVLFNWDLASRWRIPSTVESHWTISPIVRLFTSPGMLLTPWFAVVGGMLAWRAGPHARQVVTLVLLMTVAQYLINTFVLSLPPNTRYFGLSLGLMCLLAGFALSQIRRRVLAWTGYGALFVLPCLVIALAQPRPSVTSVLVEQVARDRTIHVIGQLAKTQALSLADDPSLAAEISPQPSPTGGLVAGLPYDRPVDFERKCPDGQQAYQPLAKIRPQPLLWSIAESIGLAPHLPARVARLLDGEADAIQLVRREC